MTTPALLRLREAFPQAKIVLLTHEKLAELWREHPACDAVITFRARDSVFAVARRLRTHDFSTSLILPNSVRSALESFLASIPRRVGYAAKWRRSFLTEPVAPRAGCPRMKKRSPAEVIELVSTASSARAASDLLGDAHHVHQYLHLAAQLGANPQPLSPALFLSEGEVRKAVERFGLVTRRPLFALNPGAEYGPAKRWPAERFAEAAVEVHKKTGCEWVLLGGKNDMGLTRQITQAIRDAVRRPADGLGEVVTDLAGQTTLRELCAILKACQLLLANDTGPMHVSAAVGTPVIVPFGSTSPELTGPGLPSERRHKIIRSDAVCSPCFLRECPIDFRCMLGISVGGIVAAILSTWESLDRAARRSH